ncbi:MAG: amidase [Nocardioides sp.]|nr:amidase [Nocardioides sp.]
MRTEPTERTDRATDLLADPDLPALLDVLRRYETALAHHDREVLDAAFVPGGAGAPVRAAGGAAAVGATQIAAGRAHGGPPPPRRPVRLHLRRVDGAWTATLEGLRSDGTPTQQTQVWDGRDGWRVVAAHVSHGAPPAPRPPHDDQDDRDHQDDRDDLNAWRVHEPAGLEPSGEGPLAGVRVAVKDLYDVAGHARGAGTPTVLASAPPAAAHATALQRLVDAGAGVAGIARTDELAFGLSGVNAHEGVVANPVRPGRLAGGSTSGPAAAVAAGEADLGLGTDPAGSIRVPASYCGLLGLRLTHGAVPLTGAQPLAPSFDAVGLLARELDVLRAGASVLVGGVGPDVPVERLLVPPTLLDLADPTSRDAVVAGVLALALRAGCSPEAVDVVGAVELEEWFAAFRAVQAAEAYAEHAALLRDHPDAVSPDVRDRLLAGDLPAAEVDRHRTVLARATGTIADLLPTGTALAIPSAAGPAPLATTRGAALDDVRARTLRLGCLASLAGLPALSLPTPLADGDPVGLCLVAGRGHDLSLISLAERTLW